MHQVFLSKIKVLGILHILSYTFYATLALPNVWSEPIIDAYIDSGLHPTLDLMSDGVSLYENVYKFNPSSYLCTYIFQSYDEYLEERNVLQRFQSVFPQELFLKSYFCWIPIKHLESEGIHICIFFAESIRYLYTL